MVINLYTNNSDPKKISKNLTSKGSFTGTLKNETDVVTPVVLVSGELPDFNYAKIPLFNRYYFVTDFRSVRNNLYEIHLKSDVLMSFDLTDVSGSLKESSNYGNNYLQHRNFIRTVKSKTDILSFPSGLLDSGEYILITAGG